MNYWLVVTSPANFRHDREHLHFKYQGFAHRLRKQIQRMKIGDRVVYYVRNLKKFGATATITGDYIYDNESKLWTDDNEIWPARRPSEPNIVLGDDELIDAKKLVPYLNFVENKKAWGSHFQGSIKTIPEEDFRLIESEMKKIIAERQDQEAVAEELRTESE